MRSGGAGLGVVAFGLLAAAWPVGAQQRVEIEARDRRIQPEPEPVYTVGAFDGAEWETFGEIAQVAFDAAGNLYVMDRHNSQVIVVDPGGDFVRQFGNAGEGPGEWRMPGGMGVLADGSVVISDAGHRAYMVYGPDGEYSHAVSMPESGVISLSALQTDPRGGAVFNGGGLGFTMRMSRGPDGAAPAAPTTRPIERVTVGPDGAVSTFYEAWLPPREDTDGGSISLGGGRTSFRMGGGPRAFEPRLHTGVLPDGGLAVVDSSAWAVKLVGPDGRLRGVLTRDIEPVQVTDRIREREIERRLEQVEAGEGPQMRVMVQGQGGGARTLPPEQVREMQRQQLENQAFYPEIPVVERLATSPTGTIWLERGTVNPDEPGAIDLVRADGTYLGTIPSDGIRIPSAFGPDGLVAYVRRDELDVPSVEVMRLPSDIR